MGNGPFRRLQGQKPTAVFKTAEAYIALGVHLSPKQSRLGFNEGMESRELRKAGWAQQDPVCLGLGEFEGLCLTKSPRNPSQNSFKRDSNV